SPGNLFHIDLALGAENTLDKLGRAHFQAKEGNGRRFRGMQGCVPRQVERKSRFTDCRPGSEDYEVGRLPAVRDPVQTGKPAGDPGDLFLLVPQVFDALDRLDQHRIDTVEVLPKVVVGDLEQLAFRVVKQIEHI